MPSLLAIDIDKCIPEQSDDFRSLCSPREVKQGYTHSASSSIACFSVIFPPNTHTSCPNEQHEISGLILWLCGTASLCHLVAPPRLSATHGCKSQRFASRNT
eukprot:364818-Chlamydomonas_euryale.AAC.27